DDVGARHAEDAPEFPNRRRRQRPPSAQDLRERRVIRGEIARQRPQRIARIRPTPSREFISEELPEVHDPTTTARDGAVNTARRTDREKWGKPPRGSVFDVRGALTARV